jgi:hypothetical protein
MNKEDYTHSTNKEGKWHSLIEHLENVASVAKLWSILAYPIAGHHAGY